MAGDRKRPFLRRVWPAVFYAALIFLLSSLPGNQIPELGFDLGDKLIHLVEFGLLGLFLVRAFGLTAHPYALTILAGTLYAASDEVHQFFIPGRFSSGGDFFADVLGVMLAAGILAVLRR